MLLTGEAAAQLFVAPPNYQLMPEAIDPARLSLEVHSCLNERVLIAPDRNDLLQQVVGAGGDTTGYVYGGLTVSVGLRAALQLEGRRLSEFKSILDFGCGSGRVLAWFGDVANDASLTGVDINEDAIDWCQKNLRFGQFLVGLPLPPLPFSSGRFDLIFGISVFTHLNRDYERAWLRELHRLLQPEDLLLLSFHGADKAIRSLSTKQYRAFEKSGFLYKAGSGASVEGLPDFYQVAFHSVEYVEQIWGRQFGVLRHIEHGPFYEQTLTVFNAKPEPWKRLLRPPLAVHRLPGACIDNPAVETRAQDSLLVQGWAFSFEGPMEVVDLWIDGVRHASVGINLDRPDVREAFQLPDQVSPGFADVVDTKTLGSGRHLLWVTEPNGNFPLAATYFKA